MRSRHWQLDWGGIWIHHLDIYHLNFCSLPYSKWPLQNQNKNKKKKLKLKHYQVLLNKIRKICTFKGCHHHCLDFFLCVVSGFGYFKKTIWVVKTWKKTAAARRRPAWFRSHEPKITAHSTFTKTHVQIEFAFGNFRYKNVVHTRPRNIDNTKSLVPGILLLRLRPPRNFFFIRMTAYWWLR